MIVAGGSPALLPPAAFAGAAGRGRADLLARGRGGPAAPRPGGPRMSGATASILLAGVAVAALLTAVQTYLQQQHSQTLQAVYAWILGGLSRRHLAEVWLILPYVMVAAAILLAHRRLLDVLRVGETEAGSLGVDVARLRLDRGHGRHARHRGGGLGERADRLRRHHRPAHGAADGRGRATGWCCRCR